MHILPYKHKYRTTFEDTSSKKFNRASNMRCIDISKKLLRNFCYSAVLMIKCLNVSEKTVQSKFAKPKHQVLLKKGVRDFFCKF